MYSSKTLDIIGIKELISKKHKNFIKKFKLASSKVNADLEYKSTDIEAKVFMILQCFQQQEIIDKIERTTRGAYNQFVISKTGFRSILEILSNHNEIIIHYPDINLIAGKFLGSDKCFWVDRPEFEWESFSEELLDIIHAQIYERLKALETSINMTYPVGDE